MPKNVFNNSYTIPSSYSNNKFKNIFQPIRIQMIKKIRKVKTPQKAFKKQKTLKKEVSFKTKKINRRRSPKLLVISINANTLVNKLPILYTAYSKVKNYEGIYFELIKLFTKSSEGEDNDEHYVQLYTNTDETTRNLPDKGIDAFYGINDYIRIIKKPTNVRTMLDVYLIMKFLSKTKLGKSFRDEFPEEEMYGKLITFCSMEIKYKKILKGKKVFHIGDTPDNFYIILKGKVDVIKPLEMRTLFTGNEYFLYLMNLLKKHDRYTFYLCIENNYVNYTIEKSEEKYLPYIYISIYLSKKKSDLSFKEILSNVNINPKELGLTEFEVSDDILVKKNIDRIKYFFPYKITADLIEKYYFITDKVTKKEVYIYKDEKFLSLESKSYFGDSAIDANSTRNATIIASEDTDLGYIETNLYNTHISQEKVKLRHKKLNFFLDNFFFKRLNGLTFEKKYFAYFICNNYNKGDVLFHENEDAYFAYFLEKGVVELTTTKNVLEMQMLIKILQNKRKNIENYFSQRDKNEQEMLYNNIDNNCRDLMRYINKRQNNKIILLKNNEDIGLISFFFNCPYIADCVVHSKKARIYKIDFKYLNEILANEKQCIYGLIKSVNHKLKLYHERFFNINNTKLIIADKEETHKNKEQMDLIRKELLELENKNKIRNDKSREKENKAEIGKFHEIYFDFFSNKIKKIKIHSLKNKNFISNSFLPSINTERLLFKKIGKKKNHDLLSRILSLNTSKTNRRLIKSRSQLNLLFKLTLDQIKSIKMKKIQDNILSVNKESKEENSNITNLETKTKLIQSENSRSISKVRLKEKDVFLKYFNNYATNTSNLNLSLIFNKIKNKGKYQSLKISRQKPNISRNNKDNIKSKEYSNSINQKLSVSNSNDNLLSISEKLKSKINSNSTIFANNERLKFYRDKKTSTNILNNEIEKNDTTKACTERRNINKSINHPYYSPSVILKKQKYELFTKNIVKKKADKKKIIIKSIKDLGIFHVASGKEL